MAGRRARTGRDRASADRPGCAASPSGTGGTPRAPGSSPCRGGRCPPSARRPWPARARCRPPCRRARSSRGRASVGTSVVSSHRLLRYDFEPSPQTRAQVTSVWFVARGPPAIDSPAVCTPDPLRQPAHSDDPPPAPGALKARPCVTALESEVSLTGRTSGRGDPARRRRRLRRADQAPRHRAAAAHHGAGDVLRPARRPAAVAGRRDGGRRHALRRQRQRAELRLRPRHRRADAPHPAPGAAPAHRHAAGRAGLRARR